MGMMVQFKMDLLIGISFVMNLQMSSNHLGFPAKREIEHDIELLPGATP